MIGLAPIIAAGQQRQGEHPRCRGLLPPGRGRSQRLGRGGFHRLGRARSGCLAWGGCRLQLRRARHPHEIRVPPQHAIDRVPLARVSRDVEELLHLGAVLDREIEGAGLVEGAGQVVAIDLDLDVVPPGAGARRLEAEVEEHRLPGDLNGFPGRLGVRHRPALVQAYDDGLGTAVEIEIAHRVAELVAEREAAEVALELGEAVDPNRRVDLSFRRAADKRRHRRRDRRDGAHTALGLFKVDTWVGHRGRHERCSLALMRAAVVVRTATETRTPCFRCDTSYCRGTAARRRRRARFGSSSMAKAAVCTYRGGIISATLRRVSPERAVRTWVFLSVSRRRVNASPHLPRGGGSGSPSHD